MKGVNTLFEIDLTETADSKLSHFGRIELSAMADCIEYQLGIVN